MQLAYIGAFLDILVLLGAIISGMAGNIGMAIAGIGIFLLGITIDRMKDVLKQGGS